MGLGVVGATVICLVARRYQTLLLMGAVLVALAGAVLCQVKAMFDRDPLATGTFGEVVLTLLAVTLLTAALVLLVGGLVRAIRTRRQERG